VPAAHTEHVAAPAAALKLPAPHGTQVEGALAPVAGDAVPAAHAVHPSSVWPRYWLNVPWGQARQADSEPAAGTLL